MRFISYTNSHNDKSYQLTTIWVLILDMWMMKFISYTNSRDGTPQNFCQPLEVLTRNNYSKL
uniref:Uncharacterized protein n=1 Tax=Solanum tuberosum TaxID=4113 RepID=M1AKK2_SOLTU